MSNTLFNLISLDNPVFSSYAFWSAVLILKMLSMAMLTAIKRWKTKTFANPEDLPSKKLKVKFDEEEVERVRRAHRNDLENVVPFILAGFFYVLTDPSTFLAVNLFRAAAIGRILHTIVYAVVVLPQPARALAFFVPLAATGFMAFKTVVYFL